ncbi:peroxiredoxin-like family protein [Oscillospiraceae bacterium MB08-C2-2]|nr:peroxiredoxin-like family protein [Oscillospiraceae bacterium MB08-C2-2]
MPDFEYQTPFASGLKLSHTLRANRKTAILFLRYYGCPICQLDIQEIAQNYDQIVAEDTAILIVLQSSPDKLAAQLSLGELPFDIICDPNGALYSMLGIGKASATLGMLDFKTVGKIVKSSARGIKHGDYEGEELQLPALFVANREGQLLHVHYGKSAGDIPDSSQLAALLL